VREKDTEEGQDPLFKKQRPAETAEEARLRLAREYLETLNVSLAAKGLDESGKEQTEGFDAAEMDEELLNIRIQNHEDEHRGKARTKLAHQLVNFQVNEEEVITLKGHSRAVTAVAISDDEKTVYSASKDCNIIRWNLEQRKKEWRD